MANLSPAPARSSADIASPARHDTFDHDADIGIIGRGATLEDAFVAAAEAMFGVMVDISRVEPKQTLPIAFEEADPELALVRWLNALLGEASVGRLVFGQFSLRRAGTRWAGEARGEPWRPDLDRGVEVKGATLTMLAVTQGAAGWEARCVVDV